MLHPLLALIAFSLPSQVFEEQPRINDKPKTRTFLFTYSATVTGLEPSKKARIWLPFPPSNEDQEVTVESKDLPAREEVGKETKNGNRILYLEATARKDGTIPLKIVYRVTRREVRAEADKDNNSDLAKFLRPDKKVPIDGKPLELIKGQELPADQFETARILYDVVNKHMRYSKEGTGWGQGDAVWACDSKYGNCTDFHSLFISLARSQKIPALFEIGFSVPAKHGEDSVEGYHCWAKFHSKGEGWVPVDISEANKDPKMKDYYFGNLTENRVTFSTDRDLELVPKQDGGPLNFFIYPYVEVDGKVYPSEKVTKKYGYQDVK